MPRACGDGRLTLQSVSDQELKRAVEADMGQLRLRAVLARELRRAEAEEAEVGVLGCSRGEAAEGVAAGEQLIEPVRQVAGEGRGLGCAVEHFAAGALAGLRRAEDRGQPVAARLHVA